MFRAQGVVAALIVANGAWAQTPTAPDAAASAPQNATPTAQSITVTGKRYLGEVASGGARIDAAVKDLPLSLTVATDKLIQDLQPRNLTNLANKRNFDPTNQGVREQSPRRVTVGMNAEF
jgi:outer membrane receptor protein involved in Fe transport